MRHWLLIIGIAGFSIGARAAESAQLGLGEPGSKVIPFGHNVSSTSYVLKRGACTVGLQGIGCGIFDSVSLVSSPWLIKDYNMSNLFLRWKIEGDSEHQTALQVAYFKTFAMNPAENRRVYKPNGRAEWVHESLDYDMEATWVQGIWSRKISDGAISHTNLNVQYYANDRRPYSLHRPSMRNKREQTNLSELVEVHLSGPAYLMAEAGVLDVFGVHQHLHLGQSFQLRMGQWLAHMGISMNGTWDAFFSPDRFDAQRKMHDNYNNYDDELPEDYDTKDFGIHPEFSIQYFF